MSYIVLDIVVSPYSYYFFPRVQTSGGALRKGQDCSVEKEATKKRREGSGYASEHEETQPSPAMTRNMLSLASHVYANLWEI